MASVHYSASAKGKVPRFVQCEKCGHGYGYWLRRTGFGYASSFLVFGMSTGRQRAAADADFDLEMKLKHDCEAVPCPECGWYQKHMIDRARHERFNWVQQVSWAGVGVAVLLFLFPGFLLQAGDRIPAVWIIFRACQLLGLLFLLSPLFGYLLKNHLSAGYHPNKDDVEERKTRGQARAMNPKQFAKLVPKDLSKKGLPPKLRLEDL